MNLGLYIAASGMMTEQVRQDQLTNDLANGSTPGYKPDHSVQQSFGDLLLSNTSTGQVIGPIGTGVTIKSTVTDMTQAPLQQTGQPLDFALQGTGLFAVRTPQGIRYTRDGQFSASAQGQLVDAQGDQVLGQGGAPVRVSARGTVPANALGVFNVPGAIKQGNNLYTGAAAGRASATVRQGELEGSGVDPTHTMVDMISSMRAYEAGQKAIQSIDDTMQECASSVGSIGGN